MKNTATYILKILIFASLIGFCYQFIAVKSDATKYPPIGEFVDIGGYKLYFHQTGSDSGPTVILDMGMGGNLLYWRLVQLEIAKFARVVSYDRAGMGYSDPSPKARTSENIVEELHALLTEANIPGPYILVGHSFAGINARVFANKYPEEVKGVILVDSSHEDQIHKLPKQKDFLSQMFNYKPAHTILIGLTEIGVARLYNIFTYDHKLPENIRDMLIAKNSTSIFMKSLLDEYSMFGKNLDYIKKAGYNFGDKPLTVITAGMKPTKEGCAQRGLANGSCENAYEIWQALQKDLVTKSTKGKQVIAEHSGHNIPVDQPEIIVKAVSDMLKEDI